MSTILFLNVGSGILLTLISIPLYLQKVPPNGFYGFRIRKTRENPEVWYPVNRYSAGWTMLCGMLTSIGAIGLYYFPGLSVDVYAWSCLSIFIIVFGIGIIFTLQYIKSLPGG